MAILIPGLLLKLLVMQTLALPVLAMLALALHQLHLLDLRSPSVLEDLQRTLKAHRLRWF